MLAKWERIKQDGERAIPALFIAMDEVLDTQAEKLAITRRIAGDIKDIWAIQPRFEARAGRKPYALLEQPRFKAGLDFLLLRAASGEVPKELADWWERFLFAEGDERATMLLPETGDKKKRRRRRKPASATSAAGE